MAILKCKMCGGDLNFTDGETVAVCEYCGTKQTIPTIDDEKKITLFTRANRLRAACEFDKAASVYESIVSEFNEEAEAYWGLVLCKYGIEYVDDPVTEKKIPTCHRSSFDSVMDDSNFEMVMENADSVACTVYRAEAKQIEELRKSIVEVSNKEEPYDIFICYKETDENGNRTVDSLIAQEVYDALTEKGYRVFFSRITLEDKLGQEYEPYIFAALNSAKVMLAFGTDYQYYNAVWVKNEWSRFLQLIAKGDKKTLIPCYKDIDAYDIPKEFKHLQAQDMGKVGAVQDLLRGIGKIIETKKTTPNVNSYTGVVSSDSTALVQRGNMALEDGDFKGAENFFERALDANPTDAHAHLGKFLTAHSILSLEDFQEITYDLKNDKDFKRAEQFADPQLATELRTFRESIEQKLKKQEQEAEEKRRIEIEKEKEEEKKKEEQDKQVVDDAKNKINAFIDYKNRYREVASAMQISVDKFINSNSDKLRTKVKAVNVQEVEKIKAKEDEIYNLLKSQLDRENKLINLKLKKAERLIIENEISECDSKIESKLAEREKLIKDLSEVVKNMVNSVDINFEDEEDKILKSVSLFEVPETLSFEEYRTYRTVSTDPPVIKDETVSLNRIQEETVIAFMREGKDYTLEEIFAELSARFEGLDKSSVEAMLDNMISDIMLSKYKGTYYYLQSGEKFRLHGFYWAKEYEDLYGVNAVDMLPLWMTNDGMPLTRAQQIDEKLKAEILYYLGYDINYTISDIAECCPPVENYSNIKILDFCRQLVKAGKLIRVEGNDGKTYFSPATDEYDSGIESYYSLTPEASIKPSFLFCEDSKLDIEGKWHESIDALIKEYSVCDEKEFSTNLTKNESERAANAEKLKRNKGLSRIFKR